MIQRIQSLFYFLAGVSFAGLFKFPFATSDAPVPQYLSDQSYNILDHIIMLGLTILGVIVCVIAIFLFKNRLLQLRMGYLSITLSILIPLVAFLLLYTEKTALNSEVAIHDRFGLYIPIIALLFSVLGNVFVKKDEKLVRSMDRLR